MTSLKKKKRKGKEREHVPSLSLERGDRLEMAVVLSARVNFPFSMVIARPQGLCAALQLCMAASPHQQSAAKGWHKDLGSGTDGAGADCTRCRVSLSASPHMIKGDKEKARK